MKEYRYKTRLGDTYSIKYENGLRAWAVLLNSRLIAHRKHLADARSLLTELDELSCRSSFLAA